MNMNTTAQAMPFTLNDFLAWEANEPLRHELPDAPLDLPLAQIYQDITLSPPVARPQGETT